jgi:hypothetical protein
VSPEPYVRAQALVLAAIFVAAAVLGSAIAVLACVGTCAVAARGLYAKYRRDVLTAASDVPHHRERLDLIVAGDARAALGIGAAAGGVLVGFEVDAPDIGVATATPVLVAVAGTAVYLSSLVDWYVTLPRVSGQLGVRPCRNESRPQPRFPRTWRETTRWWYVHRIAAALILRFGLSFAITLSLDRHLDLPGGATIVAAAAMGGFASYIAAAFRSFPEAGHPTMIVGRTVRRRKTERLPLREFTWKHRTVRIPGFKRRAVGMPGPREYVFDVALEGVQLVAAESREGEVPRDEDGEIKYEREPTKLKLKHLDDAKPAERAFSGCEGRCSGINWYCIENPRCFEPK